VVLGPLGYFAVEILLLWLSESAKDRPHRL